MDDTIKNEADLTSVINEYGDIAAEIVKQQKRLEIKKAQLEEYCERNNLKKFNTARYSFCFAMKGQSLLRTEKSVTTADVVAALRKDKDGKNFIYEDYDKAALKDFALGLDNTEEWLENFQLKLAKERTEIKVTPRKKK